MLTINELIDRILDIGFSDGDPFRSIKGKYFGLSNSDAPSYIQPEDIISKFANIASRELPVFSGTSPGTLQTDAVLYKLRVNFDETQIDNFIDSFFPKLESQYLTLTKENFRNIFIQTFYDRLKLRIENYSQPFSCINFKYDSLLSLKEISNSSFLPSKYYDTVQNYNYFSNYESVVINNNINENILPNLYFYENTDEVLSGMPNDYKKQITLNNIVKQNNIYTDFYFDYLSTGYTEFFNSSSESQIAEAQSITQNILIHKNDLSVLKDSKDYKNIFPYYETIKFRTEPDEYQIVKSLDDTGNECKFLQIAYDSQALLKNGLFASVTNVSTQTDGQVTQTYNVASTAYNLNNLLPLISSSYFDEVATNEFTTLQTKCPDLSVSNLQNFLSYLRLNLNLKNIANSSFVGLDKIYLTSPSFNDTQVVSYFLQKYSILNNSEQLIQTLHFLNYDSLIEFLYHDTQIKYGQQYRYVLKANLVVVGTDYSISNITTGSIPITINGYQFDFDALTYPTLKLVSGVEIFNKIISLNDSPPLPPQIRIEQYRAINNKILFLFNTEIGSRYIDPIIVKQSDENRISSYRTSQEIPSGPILYKSEDTPAFVEIYRTTTKPINYESFNNSLKNIVLFNNSFSTNYIENVDPNTTYYYMFRCVDKHGNMSNPTSVYEVKITDDSGAVYTTVNILNDFEKNKPITIKNFKRFMHITPNVAQTNVVNTDGIYSFGSNLDKVWGKEFKMRIRSKSTGKVLDFNLNFLTSSFSE